MGLPDRSRFCGDAVLTLPVEGAAAAEHAMLAHIGERHRAEIEMDLIAQLLP
jgi:hypothetical protein